MPCTPRPSRGASPARADVDLPRSRRDDAQARGRIGGGVDESERERAVVVPERAREHGGALPARVDAEHREAVRSVVVGVHDRGERHGRGSGTVRSPRPLIVTTPFVVDTEVDDGAGGSVEVVELDVVEEEDVTGAARRGRARTDVSVGVLESEHAAPSAIDAATSTTTACAVRLLRLPRMPARHPLQPKWGPGNARGSLRAHSALMSNAGACSTSVPDRGSTDPTGCTPRSPRSRPRRSASSSTRSSRTRARA